MDRSSSPSSLRQFATIRLRLHGSVPGTVVVGMQFFKITRKLRLFNSAEMTIGSMMAVTKWESSTFCYGAEEVY
jgi:hypothetical protein